MAIRHRQRSRSQVSSASVQGGTDGIGGVNREWKQPARWAALPNWLREKTVPGEKLVRVPGLGMRSAVTGEVITCPWCCTWEGARCERHLRFVLKDEAIILSYEQLRAASARCHRRLRTECAPAPS
jgi:hypothetical protein